MDETIVCRKLKPGTSRSPANRIQAAPAITIRLVMTWGETQKNQLNPSTLSKVFRNIETHPDAIARFPDFAALKRAPIDDRLIKIRSGSNGLFRRAADDYFHELRSVHRHDCDAPRLAGCCVPTRPISKKP